MYKFFKFIFDKILALLGLIILLLPLIIIAIAIKIDSKGPAIFRQERIGKNQKPFKLYKFRTMKSTNVTFDINHPVIFDDNANLTKVGRVLRKIKADEMLQLLNVLKGDMSFVGPRPLLAVYLQQYEPWELQKFKVKPGLSGLSQVSGNGYLSSQERSFYDVLYTEKISLFTDIKVVFKTLGVVFRGEERYLKHVTDEEMQKMKDKYTPKEAADETETENIQ